MKFTIIAFMLLATLQSNGQTTGSAYKQIQKNIKKPIKKDSDKVYPKDTKIQAILVDTTPPIVVQDFYNLPDSATKTTKIFTITGSVVIEPMEIKYDTLPAILFVADTALDFEKNDRSVFTMTNDTSFTQVYYNYDIEHSGKGESVKLGIHALIRYLFWANGYQVTKRHNTNSEFNGGAWTESSNAYLKLDEHVKYLTYEKKDIPPSWVVIMSKK